MDYAAVAHKNSQDLQNLLEAVDVYDFDRDVPQNCMMPNWSDYNEADMKSLDLFVTKNRLYDLRQQLDNILVETDRANARSDVMRMGVIKMQELVNKTKMYVVENDLHVFYMEKMRACASQHHEYLKNFTE